jgi:hypothetical protein
MVPSSPTLSAKSPWLKELMLLRDTIHDFLRQGNNRIILNLAHVDFIDSAGLGELVRTLARFNPVLDQVSPASLPCRLRKNDSDKNLAVPANAGFKRPAQKAARINTGCTVR